MSPWNRLRQLADRLLAGADGRARSDEAIFLSDEAYRNHQPGLSKAPEIRERHFGADFRRERTGRSDVARAAPAAGHEQDYAGTKILGTPYPARKPDIPAADKIAAASPRDAEMLRSLFGETGPSQPRKPAPPIPAPPMPAPALRASAPVPAPAMPAPAAPVAPEKIAPEGPAKPVVAAKRKKMDRGDLTIAALGVVLGVTCAVFPWYIFFNQEKFGVREFVFSGGGAGRPTSGIAYQPQTLGKPFAAGEAPRMELDFFPTATLPTQSPPQAVPASSQPFPSDRIGFRLVHVANGRAMIEDEDGLWVVQRGSLLPDASRVVSIEQRDGRWVLMTSHDRIVELDVN